MVEEATKSPVRGKVSKLTNKSNVELNDDSLRSPTMLKTTLDARSRA
jgi:hypothetical protein